MKFPDSIRFRLNRVVSAGPAAPHWLYFTSTACPISPGTVGTAGSVGTLTFRSNTIFASGTTLLIDIGTTGINDVVAVQTS